MQRIARRLSVRRRIVRRIMLRIVFMLPKREKRNAWTIADINSGMVE